MRAMKKGASRHGARAHHWRIVTTESTPVAPAASLLFQAPVFQAAPEVAPAAIVEDQPEPKRRRKSATVEEDAPREEAAPKRRRRSKKAADEAPEPEVSDEVKLLTEIRDALAQGTPRH